MIALLVMSSGNTHHLRPTLHVTLKSCIVWHTGGTHLGRLFLTRDVSHSLFSLMYSYGSCRVNSKTVLWKKVDSSNHFPTNHPSCSLYYKKKIHTYSSLASFVIEFTALMFSKKETNQVMCHLHTASH